MSNYVENGAFVPNKDFLKARRFTVFMLLITSFVFAVACTEESGATDQGSGGSAAAPASGSGGASGSQPVDTGVPDTAPPPVTGGSGGSSVSGGSGGSSASGGAGGAVPSDALVPDVFDSGISDGETPDSTSGAETGPQPETGTGTGTCCPKANGNCLCHGPDPTALTSENGPYGSESYDLRGVGCVYYPTDAEPPFAAVAVSDGFMGSGGCASMQTGRWGPLYASWGIVSMIVVTGSGDQPNQRANALLEGIEAFKAENENSSSQLYQKLAGRYGTSGFSMGGGGTTIAASRDSSLLSSVALMPWGPTGQGVTVPTLFVCGSSDGIASCRSHGTPAYNQMPETTPKMIVTVNSGHAGQPTSGGGMEGSWGLAFQKVYLEGDERWQAILLSGNYDDTNITFPQN
ncbi:MAG: hypothetical protein JXA30_01885 [Deltaproteobacteria bacterium]|nr:hypothetical protein [Deltaproteobacteria bacterium]